jgi:glycosyltransferase involved in cell wall biosynthesis
VKEVSGVRSLLVVAPAYPPMPRLLKLQEYLPELGWRPVFLVPRGREGDPRFVTEPTGRVDARADRVNPQALRWMPAFLRRQNAWTGWLRLVFLWLHTPDELVRWIPWAVVRGRRAIREHDAALILASGPPFSTALVGLLLGGLTGAPLVSDFRDAWTIDPVDPFGCLNGTFRAPPSPRRRAFLTWLERKVFERSRLVLFTSDQTCASYIGRYPWLASRSSVLYNGVDEKDFAHAPAPAEALAVTYVGTLHEFQMAQAELCLRAFAQLAESGPCQSVQFRLAGHRTPRIDARLRGLASQLGIAARSRFDGPLLHRAAIELLRGRGVQLLFAGQSQLIRLSKVSDCLATGRPILALAREDSETARHVLAAGHAVYGGSSEGELARLLRELLRRPAATSSNTPPFACPYPHRLHWQSIGEAAARLFGNLVKPAARFG